MYQMLEFSLFSGVSSIEDAGEDVETDRVKKIRLAYAKELARNDKI